LLESTPCQIRNLRADAVIANRLELAADSKSRNRGLLGRDHLEAGAGLVIVPCSSVHTFFMRFAIDVLFVGRDGTIVKCVRDLRPWRIAVGLRAYAVVEVAAGTLRASETERGDRVVFEPSAARG
jgi:uncharacterized membrane protein (UPF0127 family)